MRAYRKALTSMTVALGFAAVGFLNTAQAVPMLKLSSGATTVTVTDGAIGDLSGDSGIVGWNGTIGNFTINFTTGLTKPELGSASEPVMDVISLNSTFGGPSGGALTIMFSETDFATPGPDGLTASIGGTTDGKVTYQTYRDLGNTHFELGELLTNTGPMTGPVFGAGSPATLSEPLSPYSLTMVMVVEHDGKNQATSFNAELVPQPEPGTMLFFGTGLLGLVGYAWRRQKQVA